MIGRILRFLGGVLLLAGTAFLASGKQSGGTPKRGAAAPVSWKWWAFRGASILALLGVGGFLLTASGLISIKASSGHWAVTRWFLNFAKERSVATHSFNIQAPRLDEHWLVLRGAAHFETGCRPCHGAPDVAQPRITTAMTPHPPPLAKEISQWDASELFYIVKHGIKFTGMPGWPSKFRDDEVWAMVAFLKRLPELDAAAYRELVHGNAELEKQPPVGQLLPPKRIAELVTQNCARCHGTDGNGRGAGAFPKLAGQSSEYLYASLAAYASGERHSGIMEPIAAALSEETWRELADYYARQPRSAAGSDRTAYARGEAIARNGIPEKQVPACAECHLPAAEPKNPIYPSLAGQYPEYLALQLQLFKAKHRGGTSYSHIMQQVVKGLSTNQFNDLAAFFAGTPPDRGAQEQALSLGR